MRQNSVIHEIKTRLSFTYTHSTNFYVIIINIKTFLFLVLVFFFAYNLYSYCFSLSVMKRYETLEFRCHFVVEHILFLIIEHKHTLTLFLLNMIDIVLFVNIYSNTHTHTLTQE